MNRRSDLSEFLDQLGPGLVTGAADDDPSGIATFSIAGAAYGYGTLWTALLTFPLMAAVQLMCSRLGMVSGRGLAAVVRRRYSRWVLFGTSLLLIVANLINIAADLGGMAEATQMVTGIRAGWFIPVYAGIILCVVVFASYRFLAKVFKWLTLVLFAYVIAAFLAHPEWPAVLRATFIPDLRWSTDYLSTLVAIFGTCISPYLFFWQAGQEVEEERAMGRVTAEQRRGATGKELRRARVDVLAGMFFSNLVMYFIILTTGATLHAHGITTVTTASQAAEALKPIAGPAAYWLFALGLVGTGMLGVPVLAGSSAYAVAEAMSWRASLDRKPTLAPKFYGVLAVSVALGGALDYLGIDAVKMLFWSAVANGVLAPPLIVIVILLTSDSTVMGDRVNSPLMKWGGWICAALMAAAAVAMSLSA